AHPQPSRAPRSGPPRAGARLPRPPVDDRERAGRRGWTLVERARRLLAASPRAPLRAAGAHLRATSRLLRRARSLPRANRPGGTCRRPPPRDPREPAPHAGTNGGVLRPLGDAGGGAAGRDDRRPRSPVGGGSAATSGLRGGAGRPRESARAALRHAARG